jgi:hypothetical protein
MPRYFRVEQAERLLPEVRAAIQRAIDARKDYEDSEQQLQKALRRIAMLGGSIADRDSIAADRMRRDQSAKALNEAIGQIHEFGCLVKDLDMGLIDFPTRLNGREVLLCWKLGEDGIGWWHGTEEGFRGRKPIDDDFLANHEGERPSEGPPDRIC